MNTKIEILQMEYNLTYGKLLYLDDQANKYVSHILTAVAALIAVMALLIGEEGISDKINFSILIAAGALIIGLLIIMVVHHTVQCYRLGGYMKYLEENINHETNSSVLKWESLIAEKYIHKDITSCSIFVITGFIFAILLAGAGYVSVVYIWPKWWFVTVMIFTILALEILAGILYLRKAFTVHNKMYTIVMGEASQAEPQPGLTANKA